MTQSSFATRSLRQLAHPMVADRLRPLEAAARRSATQITFCVRGVISPLLANCYFRRFLLAWRGHGHQDQLDAHVVNYADDLVICCRPGNAAEALARMSVLMTRLGLEVNTAKTRIARLPEDPFDFAGDTGVHFFGEDG